METLTRIEDDIATLQKHMEINDESGEDTVAAEITGIKIGGYVLISAPVEALVEVGLNLKKHHLVNTPLWRLITTVICITAHPQVITIKADTR